MKQLIFATGRTGPDAGAVEIELPSTATTITLLAWSTGAAAATGTVTFRQRFAVGAPWSPAGTAITNPATDGGTPISVPAGMSVQATWNISAGTFSIGGLLR